MKAVDRTTLYKFCAEEQIAYIENARAFLPQLDATANSLRTLNGFSYNDVLTVNDLIYIANSIDTGIYFVKRSKMPSNDILAMVSVNLNTKHYRHVIAVQEEIATQKKLFCIGHELGHIIKEHDYLINSEEILNFKQYRQYLRNEFEANYIAGALLLNRIAFKNDIEDTRYNIKELSKKYNVSYETIAHRMTHVIENTHFIKLDREGEIYKRFNSSTDQIFLLPVNKPCLCSSAQKVLIPENPNIMCQISHIMDKNDKEDLYIKEKLMCISMFIEKCERKYSLTIGCRFEDCKKHNIFSYYRNNFEIKAEQISPYDCDKEKFCPLRSKLKNCPYY
jgi:Zn-dependent peptidase ImmA (M78 family)